MFVMKFETTILELVNYITRISNGTCFFLNLFVCHIPVHDDMIFKIEHKSYIASGSVHPPPFFQWKILGAHLGNMYGVFKADIRQERMEDTS